jgi:hypothetical protein
MLASVQNSTYTVSLHSPYSHNAFRGYYNFKTPLFWAVVGTENPVSLKGCKGFYINYFQKQLT